MNNTGRKGIGQYSRRSFRFQITSAFILMASVVVLIQMFLFGVAIKDSEDAVIERRLSLYRDIALRGFQYHMDNNGVLSIDSLTTAYKGHGHLPDHLRENINQGWHGVQEISLNNDSEEYMALTVYEPSVARDELIYIIENISQLEANEHQSALQVGVYSIAGIILFALTCLSMVFIVRRLTAPLIKLSHQLHHAESDDLSLLDIPKYAPEEVRQLVTNLNHYRQRLKHLIERERSFTSFASHELRTPLTVMRGVATLLTISTEPSFIQRQQQRLIKATTDMNDVVETLLGLIRDAGQERSVPTSIGRDILEQVLEDNRQLLTSKAVDAGVILISNPIVRAPESVIRILLSNLVRNAMAHTSHGSVTVEVNDQYLRVIDSGSGLNTQSQTHEGYGIGLLIVNDICRKYGWTFSLTGNNGQPGCTASVQFNPGPDQ
ncbi:sensor histidine kinase [Endozoicomonas acroporae]|uniref:sensor histidine kinase n=1 Tax=Endozoicomonas acroporae TaxID=1701104 RepID=UPI000C78F0B7|nr:HAMP domain-containing sensor histidine kinase [Endozoicomonas acroporae]